MSTPTKIHYVAFYCESRGKCDPRCSEAAGALGILLANREFRIV